MPSSLVFTKDGIIEYPNGYNEDNSTEELYSDMMELVNIRKITLQGWFDCFFQPGVSSNEYGKLLQYVNLFLTDAIDKQDFEYLNSVMEEADRPSEKKIIADNRYVIINKSNFDEQWYVISEDSKYYIIDYFIEKMVDALNKNPEDKALNEFIKNSAKLLLSSLSIKEEVIKKEVKEHFAEELGKYVDSKEVGVKKLSELTGVDIKQQVANGITGSTQESLHNQQNGKQNKRVTFAVNQAKSEPLTFAEIVNKGKTEANGTERQADSAKNGKVFFADHVKNKGGIQR